MPRARNATPLSSSTTGRRNRVSVLVAEDHPADQLAVRNLLEEHGYRVTVAEDGLAAIRIWRSSPLSYDVILMNIDMPNLDGLEATYLIRRLESSTTRRIPIVAHLSQNGPIDIKRCFSAGMSDSVVKPATPHVLYQAIERAMPTRHAHPVCSAAGPEQARAMTA